MLKCYLEDMLGLILQEKLISIYGRTRFLQTHETTMGKKKEQLYLLTPSWWELKLKRQFKLYKKQEDGRRYLNVIFPLRGSNKQELPCLLSKVRIFYLRINFTAEMS